LNSKLMAVVAVAACAALVVVGTAIAGTVGTTTVTIQEQNGDFQGRVKSNQPDCRGDRKVVLFKQRKGPDDKIASDTSENNGDWSTGNTHVNHGKYYAKARRVQFAMKRGLVGCEPDKSRVVTVN
jgi:hypothetical protein